MCWRNEYLCYLEKNGILVDQEVDILMCTVYCYLEVTMLGLYQNHNRGGIAVFKAFRNTVTYVFVWCVVHRLRRLNNLGGTVVILDIQGLVIVCIVGTNHFS